MKLFVDTSAFYAILDSSDGFHKKAGDIFLKVLRDNIFLFSSNYVMLETIVLLQNRIGLDSVNTFEYEIMPVINLHWIDEMLHKAAMSNLIAVRNKNISFVDFTSFALMRELRIENAFTFDEHFSQQGFNIYS